jgi:signal transduction histidine kinase
VTNSALDLTIGGLEIILAVTVLRQFWQFRRGFPWLVVLTSFFMLRGADRVAGALTDDAPQTFGFALDAVLLLVLVLLLFTIGRVVRDLEIAEDAALMREREYRRALADYRRLVRHRLATPLTSILGSVRFLRELEPTELGLREQLLETLEREAVRLECVCLDPADELRAEERDLRPRPNIGPELGASSRGERAEASSGW